MKNKRLFYILTIVALLFVGFNITSCEEDDPTGTIVIDNQDAVEYSIYFNDEYLGKASELTKTTFEATADCGDIKVEGGGENEKKFHCLEEDEQYTLEVDLKLTTLTLVNKDFCTYKCYFDGEYLGDISKYATEKTFIVEAKTAEVKVVSSDCGKTGTATVTVEQDKDKKINIDLVK
jgi:hypothetical protein